jgi:hypothetical protein
VNPQRVVLLVAFLLVVGCGSPQPTSSRPSLFFPTASRPESAVLLAQTEGTLDIVGPCIVLRSDGGGSEFLIIWPWGYHADSDIRGVMVVGGDGRAVVGDRVSLFGGAWEDSPDDKMRPRVEELIGKRVPAECDFGRYWIGGLRS